jgi:glutamine amidotransferase
VSSVAVIEYGIGNLGSVVNGCRRAGVEPTVVCNGEELRRANCEKIILPGVGAIGAALKHVRERGLDTALEELVIQQRLPFLGICVGMQILAERCEEFGSFEGLGWIPGTVRRLAEKGSGLRLPHVGWNDVEPSGDDPLFGNVEDRHFYFVHSYAFECPDEFVIGRCTYGKKFVCAIRRDNISAVQFHPEKSSSSGLALLRAFIAS